MNTGQGDLPMKTTTLINPFTLDTNTTSNYEVLENEVVKGKKFEGLTISGSLFSLMTFDEVSFLSCVFYASKMENCTFKGVTFENCTFEFTNIYNCNFIACTFKNCKWAYSPNKKSTFSRCELDHSSRYFLAKESTLVFEDCFTVDPKEDMTHTTLNYIELFEKWAA